MVVNCFDPPRIRIGDRDELQRDSLVVMRKGDASTSSGGTAIGKDSDAMLVVSTVMRRASACAAS
jgi:hypothetical protein